MRWLMVAMAVPEPYCFSVFLCLASLVFQPSIYSGGYFISSLWLPFLLRIGIVHPAACSQGHWLMQNWSSLLLDSQNLKILICIVILQKVLKNVAFSKTVCSRSCLHTPFHLPANISEGWCPTEHTGVNAQLVGHCLAKSEDILVVLVQKS